VPAIIKPAQISWRHPIVKLDARAAQKPGLRQFGQVAQYLAPLFSTGLLASFYLATPGALTYSGLAFYSLLGLALGLTPTRGLAKSLRIAGAERRTGEETEKLRLANQQVDVLQGEKTTAEGKAAMHAQEEAKLRELVGKLQGRMSSMISKLKEFGVQENEFNEETFDGHNVFVKKLGQGGMGIVVLVKNLDLKGKLQVWKILLPAALKDPMALERFKSCEATIMANLDNNHNLVRFFDLFHIPRATGLELLRRSQLEEYESLKAVADSLPEEWPCIKMEYIQSPNLETVLTQNSRLDQGTAVKLASDIARTLQYVGRHNVIHRDLKPENIFIVPDEDQPDNWTVKIMDFGLAKETSLTEKKASLTMVGSPMGTPYYMSPEQWAGAPDIDWRTDQFALGVILFQMISGQLPFQGDQQLQVQALFYSSVATQILNEPPPDLRLFDDKIPDRLRETVEKMLAKRKEARFGSWDAVLDALDHSFRGSPLRA